MRANSVLLIFVPRPRHTAFLVLFECSDCRLKSPNPLPGVRNGLIPGLINFRTFLLDVCAIILLASF